MSALTRAAELEQQLADLTNAETARRVWDAAAEARGARPTVPTVPPAPKPPAAERPDLDAARAIIQAQDAIARDRARAEEALTAARARAAEAEAKHKAAAAEAARAAAVVKGLRDGPSELLRRQLDLLGDTGRLRVRVEDGEAVAEVLNSHGLWVPALEASRGERLAAGLDFRASYRATAARYLSNAYAAVPILLDNRQDADGDVDLSARAPVVEFVTATGDLTTRAA